MSPCPYFLFTLLSAHLLSVRFAEGKVLILGGGLAGLQAAQTLKDNGVDFLLLEGSDHVGGRAAAGSVDEVAGDSFYWPRDLENTNGDPLASWFAKCNLTWNSPGSFAFDIINSSGVDVTSVAIRSLGRFLNILTKAAKDYESGLIPDSRSPSLEALLNMYGWHPKNLHDRFSEWFFFEQDYGLSSAGQSATHYLFLTSPSNGLDKDVKFFYASNELKSSKMFPKCMRDTIFSGNFHDKLVLNAKVTSISYTSSGVSVTTESNTTYEGDYAIVTFSLGVLQQGLVEFKPELPYWKRLAWSEFTMTTTTVIYAVFDQKLSLAKGYYTYATQDLNNNWIRDISSTLSHLPEYSNKTVLHLYSTGRHADRLADQTWDETVQNINTMLRNMFGKEPSNIYMTSPVKDSLLLGGSPTWPVGASWEDFDDVRRPVKRLFFAGDLCWYYRWTRSAIISGMETANVVTSCMNGQSCTYRQFGQTASDQTASPVQCPTTSPVECPTTKSGEPRLGAGIITMIVACLLYAA